MDENQDSIRKTLVRVNNLIEEAYWIWINKRVDVYYGKATYDDQAKAAQDYNDLLKVRSTLQEKLLNDR